MPQADRLRESTMRHSIYDGSLWAIMYNTGYLFLTPFAIAINAPLAVITALNALPSFLEGVGQKASSYFDLLGWNRKDVFLYSVVLESVAWLLLSIVAFAAWKALDLAYVNYLTIALAAAVFLFEGTSAPAWFALMGDVVPEDIRAGWFGTRSRILNAAGLAALIFAGMFMDRMGAEPLLGFVILFFIAFVSRGVSSYFVYMHWDPRPKITKNAEPSGEFSKYLWVLMLLTLSLNISGPYLAVYMLKLLGFDYATYSVALASVVVMNVLAYPHWGRLVGKYGSKTVMVSVMALSALPMIMWVYTKEPLMAIAASLLGGLFWSGTVMSTFNYVYEFVEPRARVRAKGSASLFYGTGSFLGAVIGGAMLYVLGDSSVSSFQYLFLAAALLRVAVSIIIYFGVGEAARSKVSANPISMMAKVITIYPLMGLAYDFAEITSRIRRVRFPKRQK